MVNNILISRETRKVINKDEVFIGMEGENLQEVLIFNLDEQIEGNAIIEILFPDESTAYIEIEKTERGYELPVKSSLLTQNGIVKMQLRIIQAGQEIFKSDLIRFKVKKSINATETIPEQYPTWIDNLEALKLNLENAEKQRVEAEKGRVDAEKQRVETFNQMGQDVDNVIGNIVDLQEAYDKNAADKIKEFNDNADNKLNAHNTNALQKTAEFNSNVDNQTKAFDEHVQDKITEYDEHTEELTNRLDGIDEKDTAQDKLIEDLQNQIIDLETENENIKNQIPAGQAEGENITLNDSADMDFKELRIGGNSWQETRSENLIETVDTVNSYIEYDGSLVSSGEWTATETYVEVEPNMEYYITASNIGKRLLYAEYSANDVSAIIGLRKEITPGEAFITSSNCKYVRFCTNNAKASNFDLYYKMPSPEFPSPIRNVGDNVNEFDKNNYNLIKGYLSGNSIIAESLNNIFYIPCSSKATYTVSKKAGQRFGVGYSEVLPVVGGSTYGAIFNNTGTSITITTGDNARYLIVYARNGNIASELTLQEVLDSLKIQKGSKATPYSPYNCGNFNETVCNGNLFDSQKITTNEPNIKMIIDDEGIINLSANINEVGYLFINKKLKELCPYLKVGDVAYLKMETTHNYKYIFLHGISDTWFDGYAKTITQEMLDGYIAIYGGNNGKTDTIKIMVTLDKLAANYIPHQSQQFTFPLAEGQRMPIRSYLTDKGIEHNRWQDIFDGSEDEHWSIELNQDATMRFWISLKTNNNLLFCNFFKHRETGVAHTQTNYIYSDGTALYINIEKSNLISEDVEGFRDWLFKHPLKVEYNLEKPIIEPYTEAQQLVYNEIKKAHSYKNVTHIFSTDEIKPIVKTIYRKDLETLDKNKEERLLALENAILGGN